MKNVGDAVHVTSLRLGLQEIWLHFFSAPAIDCASVQGTTHQFDVSELEQVKSLMIMIFPWFEAMDSCKQCFMVVLQKNFHCEVKDVVIPHQSFKYPLQFPALLPSQ